MPLDLASWMDSVDGAKRLSELSIPGTHDSGSRYIDPTDRTDPGTSPRLTTQTASIREQLDFGIRFLDIRVGYTDNEFRLYHEDIFLELDFGQVRDTCRSFLAEHPREAIILSLKKEDDAPTSGNNGNVTFQGRFSQYVADNPSLWYLDNRIPKLSGVRGKIVLFRRFDLQAGTTQSFGIDAVDFPDDTTGTITINDNQKLIIQDKYNQAKANKPEKWAAVKALLDDARDDRDKETLYLNFGSAAATAPVDFPLSVANFINPNFLSYFASNPRGRFGIVAMDFQTAELNRVIVRTNGLAS